jgi:pimeloyl-ACP methyl ester carboxylesterase
MRRLPFGRLLPLLLAALALSLMPSPSRSDAPKAQKLLFETFDKVQIQGTWFPSGTDGPKSPCVILVHKIGGNHMQEGWESLAQALQEKGFAVLAFDFRGHGDSKTIKPDFWSLSRTNTSGIKGANAKKESIDWKDFTPAYMPMLINDIAAAKLELERRNNAKECNANEVYVVGAEDGAALGMMWMATEWNRRKRGFNQVGQLVYNPDPEGKDLAGLVLLSPKQVLGTGASGVRVPTGTVFNNQKMREMPICLFFGDEDQPGKAYSTQIFEKVLNAPKLKTKMQFNIPIEKTKLVGNELLGKKALGTDDFVVKFLSEKVHDARPAKAWGTRDVPEEGKAPINPLIQTPLTGLGITLP